jgi:hypothetical protein
MEITKQLAVFLDNRPGTLARVCEALAESKVNILALTTSDTVDHSVVRMVVDDSQTAVWLLEEHGAMVVEDDVVLVEGNNKSGSLADIARTLRDAKVNIEYLYCATPPTSRKGLLVLRVDDPAKALKALEARNGK